MLANLKSTVRYYENRLYNSIFVNMVNSFSSEGMIEVESLPDEVKERLINVENNDAMFALTKENVQNGDIICVNNSYLYMITDDSKLTSMLGYKKISDITDVTWEEITQKPTTIAGFGIENGVTTNTEQNITGTKTFSNRITGLITEAQVSYKLKTARNLSLTGAVTGNINFDGNSDVVLNTFVNHTHTFNSLTEKPTTINGYGITDASLSTHTHTFNSLTEKPTTINGYGINKIANVALITTEDGSLTLAEIKTSYNNLITALKNAGYMINE